MVTEIQRPSKKTVKRLSTRPELADGFYAFVPQQVTRIDTEEKPLRIMLRISPLKDPEDSNSVDKGFSEFVHIYPDAPNPANPDVKPWPFMVDQGANYILAAFDDLQGKVRFVNKMPVVDGEAIEKSGIDGANAAAVEGALERIYDLWMTEDLDSVLLDHMVYGKVRRYTKKNGETGKALDFYRELPKDAELLPRSEWEYYGEEE